MTKVHCYKEDMLKIGPQVGWGIILCKPWALEEFLKRLFQRFGHIDILEIGCWKGMLVGWLHEKFPKEKFSWDYWGIDIVELPDRRKDYPHLIMNAEALEFPGNQFHAIIMLEVLEHIPDYVHALRECYRVLKPGGGIFIQSVICYDRAAINDPSHFHVLHPVTLKRLLHHLGFVDVDFEEGPNFAIWAFKPRE